MELAHFKAAMNGNVNDFPFSDINNANMSDTFNKVSPSGNSLLHVAASSDNIEITELMVRCFPSLLTQKNYEGNTALHVAARAGKLNTAKILVDRAIEFGNIDTLLTMTNDQGNTALHEALFGLQVTMNNFKDKALKNNVDLVVALARCLVPKDQESSYYYQKNTAGKSHLRLAIECGNKDFLEYLLRALSSLSVSGPEEKHLLQVIVEKKNFELLDVIKKLQPELFFLRDEKGNTLLHYAASIGHLKLVCYLLEIKGDSPQGLERNKEGLYPLHVACENGHIQVMEELLRPWPYPTELLSDKGQTILHVAAKSGKEKMVRYILKQKYSDKLINKMEKDGNTALHLAALHSHSLVVGTLLWDKRSVLELMNNNGDTAYDVAEKQSEILDSGIYGEKKVHGKVPEQPVYVKIVNVAEKQSEILDSGIHGDKKVHGKVQPVYVKIVNHNDESSNQQPARSKEIDHPKKSKEPDLFQTSMTFSILFVRHYFGFFSPHGYLTNSCSRSIESLRNKRKPLRKEDVKERINSLLVIATIIVAATFGASHQLPEIDSVADETALSWFLLCDNISMSVSVMAAIALCWTQLVDTKLAYLVILAASAMLGFALFSMCIAFCAAIFIGVSHYVGWFIFLNSTIQFMALISMFFLSLPLIFPFRWMDTVTPIGYFLLFVFYSVIYRMSDCIVLLFEKFMKCAG